MARDPKELFGADATVLEVMLHLVARLKGFEEGPFKAGFQTAIEEAGAYIDGMADDGNDITQTLMEQMCGLVNGDYILSDMPKRPIGVVQPRPPRP